MPAPSPLKIATDAVSRLTKEEKMYQKELTSQQERVKKLEADLKNGSANEDGNAEFMVKQEVNTDQRPFSFRLASRRQLFSP